MLSSMCPVIIARTEAYFIIGCPGAGDTERRPPVILNVVDFRWTSPGRSPGRESTTVAADITEYEQGAIPRTRSGSTKGWDNKVREGKSLVFNDAMAYWPAQERDDLRLRRPPERRRGGRGLLRL